MTVAVQTPTISYLENGSTTVFAVPFRYDSPADLRATRQLANGTIVELANGTAFTATPGPTNAGGTLTLTEAGPSGTKLTIFRSTARNQTADYVPNGPFDAASHERAIDKAMLVAQEQDAQLARTVVVPRGEAGLTLPASLNRLGKVFAFDADGLGVFDIDAQQLRELIATGYDPAFAQLASQVMFLATGVGAVARTVQDKAADFVSAKDFGMTGAKIALAIAAHQTVLFPAGAYTNADTAIVQPFGHVARFQNGAALTNSGAGSVSWLGTLMHENYNPSGMTGWTGTWPIAGFNFVGFSVDIAGYGPRTFGKPETGQFNKPTAIGGAVSVPSNSAMFGALGVSGHVKNASVLSNAVALFGQADRMAANALVWGLNTVTWDNGFGGLNVWGYELNLNISNVNTIALGLDLVGGSTVEPNLSIAVQVQALGVFESPKKRWTYGLRTRDAAAIVGIELGAQLEAANSPSQSFRMNFMTGAGTPGTGYQVQVDGSGNAQVNGGTGATLFVLRTPASTAGNIQLLGDGIGFFGAFPQGKRTVTGSRGGNAALASLLTGLSELGLLTDSTSA